MLDKEELEILILLENMTIDSVHRVEKAWDYPRFERAALKYLISPSKSVDCGGWSKDYSFKMLILGHHPQDFSFKIANLGWGEELLVLLVNSLRRSLFSPRDLSVFQNSEKADAEVFVHNDKFICHH